ncbi:hypothetical protein Fmac_026715 [Flemingia macrophylla]|uniref:Uncharacterized protein n=1 Tax=Flemingia macrophylla TaxID=520843 RepID=A0ABD1LFT6_9FABA
MDHCLTELLFNQVMTGNKLEKNFKTSAYSCTKCSKREIYPDYNRRKHCKPVENMEETRFDVNLTPNYEEHAETPAVVVLANNVEMSYDGNASDEVQGSSKQMRARPSFSQSQSRKP